MTSRIAIGAALLAAAALGALAVAYSNAQPEKPAGRGFSAAQEEAIEGIVRDYLMAHPEVVIDALNSYAENERARSAEQAKISARENLPSLLDATHGVTAGANPAAAKVAVIELFDYHCSFCKRAAGLVQNLMKSDPAVKVIFREFPILRDESDYAAEFALAARAQGKYADLHFALMNAGGVLTKDRIWEIAAEHGIDVAAAEAALQDPSIKAAIDETHRIASEMAVDGTPAFIIASLDGDFVEVISGFREDDLAAAIKAAKQAKRKK